MITLINRFTSTLCLFMATLGLFSTQAEDLAINENVSDQTGATVIQTQLVPSHVQATPGSTIQVAWQFSLLPEWHIYWKNAGDSGLPPELQAQQGTLSEFTFPVPHPISLPPIMNYGYKNAVTFTANYTLPETLEEGNQTLAFSGNFLYCKDVCMPGTVKLDLPITIGATNEANPQYNPVQNLPESLPEEVEATVDGNIVTLTLPASLVSPQARFIPDEDGIIDDNAAQPISGNQLTIQLDTQAQTKPTTLQGLLLINDKAYTVNTPLTQSAIHSKSTPPSVPGLPQALFFAFLAGIILNLMPCVLPVLSLKVLSLVRHHHGADRSRHTAAYTAGVLASFWAFAGVIALLQQGGTQLGWGFHLQNPLFVAGLALLMLTLALQFFGVFELGHSLTRLASIGSKREKLWSSFSTGVLAVIVATPCTVPFMGSAMAYALTQSLGASILVFTALGLGMALPFLLTSIFPALLAWLPKPGAWMSTFRHALGWPMLLTAIWMLYVFANQTSMLALFGFLLVLLAYSFTLWLYGAFPRKTTALLALLTALAGLMLLNASLMRVQPQTWEEWSSEKIISNQDDRPIFVDFTADWCVTCKVTEATVLNTESVQSLFARNNTLLLKADWTKQNPAITQELERHGRRGVPLYLLYLPGETEPRILPQLLTQGILEEALQPESAAE